MQIYSGGPNQFDDVDIFLVGAGVTLVFDAPTIPANGSWTSYSVALVETAGWRIDTLSGAAPSQAQMQSVLGDLTSLRLRAEFQTGSDTGFLDNVQLVPEPSTALFGLIGSATLFLRRNRNDRNA